MKNKKYIHLIIIAVLAAALSVLMIGCGKTDATEPVENTREAEEQTQDNTEAEVPETPLSELAAQLSAEGTATVEVKEDIYIREPLHVYGKKTLTGSGRIIMELDADQYQHMLELHNGAELIMDGATVDGNGAGSCVLVPTGAKLMMLSGTLTYGSPYGAEVLGEIEMTGGTISETLGAAVYIRSNGKGTVTGGEIVKNAYHGIKTERDGNLTVSGNAVITDSGFCLVHNSGTCEITGGTMHNGGAYIAYNMGDLTVDGTSAEGGKLEWYGANIHAISQGKTGNLNVNGLYFHDTGWHGISSTPGTSTMTLKNIKAENVTQASFYLRTGATLENVEVKNTGTAGVYVGNGSVVNIKNLTVEKSGGRGLWNFGGTVTASNVKIYSSKEFGVTSTLYDGKKGSVTINGLVVDGTEKDNAVSANNSTIIIKKGEIRNTASNGVIAMFGGQVKLTDVKIKNQKNFAVVASDKGSFVSMKNVTMEGGKRGAVSYHGTISGNGVKISNTKEFSITSSYTDSVINISNLKIDGCKGQASVNVGGSKTTLKNVVITNTAKNGIDVNQNGKLTADNVTITAPGAVGMNIIGATVVGNKITITKAGNYAIYSQKEKKIVGNTKITNLNVDTTFNQAISCNGTKMTLTNISVANAGKPGTPKCGVYVIKGGVMTLKNAKISNTAYTGLYVEDGGATANVENVEITGGDRGIVCYSGVIKGSKVNVKDTASFAITSSRSDSVIDLTDVNIKGCKFDGGGVVNCGGANVTLKDLVIDGAPGHGMNVDGGGTLTVKNATIKNIGKWCGVYASGGTFKGSDITIESPKYNGVEVLNGGKAEVSNLNVTTPGHNGVLVTDGSFSGSKVSITDGTWHGIHVQSAGTAKLDGAKLTDNGLNGIFNEGGALSGKDVTIVSKANGIASSGGTVDLSKVKIEAAPTNGVNIYNNAGVKLSNLEIAQAGVHGINLEKGSTLTLNTASISNITNYNGIYVNGGTMTGSNITIDKPKYNCIEVLNSGSATIDGFTATNAPRNGLLLTKGTADIKNAAISGNGYHGIEIAADGTATVTTAEIKNNNLNSIFVNGGTLLGGGITATSKAHGLAISGGTVDVDGYNIIEATNQGVNIYNNSTVKIANLTVGKAGIHGINLEKGSTLTLNTASISNITSYNGIYVNGGTLTGSNITIDKPKYNGIEVLNSGSATVDGFTANNAPRNGALVTKGTLDVKNVSLSGNKYHGIDVEKDGILKIDTAEMKNNTLNGIFVAGGKATGKAVSVDKATQGLAADGGNVEFEGYTIKNTTSNGIKVYNSAKVKIKTLSIDTTTSNHGVYVLGNAEMTVDGGTVTGAYLNPFFVEGGKLLGGGITVSSFGGNGMAISGGTVDVDGYTVTSTYTNRYGINIYNSSSVKLANLTIGSAGVHGINVETGSTLTLNTASISNVATYNGIYVNGGTLTGSNITIDKPKYNGIEVLNSGSATIDGFSATNAPRNGALVTKGTLDVKNATFSGNTYHGIDVAAAGTLKIEASTLSGNTLNCINTAGSVTGSNLTMSSLPFYAINASGGTLSLNGATITGATRHAFNLNGTVSANMENVAIDGTGWEGIGLYDTASLTLKNSSILNWHTLPVKNAGTGTYTAINVTTS